MLAVFINKLFDLIQLLVVLFQC